jgi:hypothetical protein
VRLTRLPRPDYRRHPAYGGMPGRAGVAVRLRATARVLLWMAVVAARRAVRYDQRVTEGYTGPIVGESIAARLARVPLMLPQLLRSMVADRRAARQAGGEGAVPTSARPLLETLRSDGIAVSSMPDEDLQRLHQLLDEPISAFRQRRDDAGPRTFEGNQGWLNDANAPGAQELVAAIFERAGVLDVASAYLGRPVAVRQILAQINDPADDFNRRKFADVGLPDPETNYMHVDTASGTLKCVVYLSHVTDANGPFGYVRGSNRFHVGYVEGLVRRATDRAGLSGYEPDTRRAFSALPAPLRQKATFGSDLLDGSSDAEELVAAEYRFTSADGNLAIFDNSGVHRGALVAEGERVALFALLA